MKRLHLIILSALWSTDQWIDHFSSSIENWYVDAALFELDSSQNLHLNAQAVANNNFFCNSINGDHRKAATIAQYIIYLEAINDGGKIVKTKKTCVLGGHI